MTELYLVARASLKRECSPDWDGEDHVSVDEEIFVSLVPWSRLPSELKASAQTRTHTSNPCAVGGLAGSVTKDQNGNLVHQVALELPTAECPQSIFILHPPKRVCCFGYGGCTPRMDLKPAWMNNATVVAKSNGASVMRDIELFLTMADAKRRFQDFVNMVECREDYKIEKWILKEYVVCASTTTTSAEKPYAARHLPTCFTDNLSLLPDCLQSMVWSYVFDQRLFQSSGEPATAVCYDTQVMPIHEEELRLKFSGSGETDETRATEDALQSYLAGFGKELTSMHVKRLLLLGIRALYEKEKSLSVEMDPARIRETYETCLIEASEALGKWKR